MVDPNDTGGEGARGVALRGCMSGVSERNMVSSQSTILLRRLFKSTMSGDILDTDVAGYAHKCADHPR